MLLFKDCGVHCVLVAYGPKMNEGRLLKILNNDAYHFHGVSFNTKDRTVHHFTPKTIITELEDEDVFSWIDIAGPDIAALNEVLQLLDIHLVLVNFFNKPEILPRTTEHPKCLAFYLYEVTNPERHLDTSLDLVELDVERMILVLGKDFIVTFHQRDLEVVDYVKDTCADNFRLAGKTPGFIVFLFLQRCLYDYAHINLANDNYLDSLESGVWKGETRELVEKIAVAGMNILTLKKLNASLHIVLMIMATKRSPFVTEEARASYRDMLMNCGSIREANDTSRDLLDSVIGSLQAEASNRTTEVARVLTVMSAIFLPLTLLTGVYGMNFSRMPELQWYNGYFMALGLMATIAVTLLCVFYRAGWLWARKKKK